MIKKGGMRIEKRKRGKKKIQYTVWQEQSTENIIHCGPLLSDHILDLLQNNTEMSLSFRSTMKWEKAS